ncbi:MAG: Uncharacterised protein [Polaribacter sp. SA4-10]|nr:MAG: Uncharacterised protein [Polaribacter sp. SA4-10]
MRVIIALFFSLLFTIVLTAPSVISLMDETQEISIFLDLNEEEESNEGKNGEKSKTDAEVKLLTASQNGVSDLNKIQEKRNIRFRSKYYFSEYSKIDTPPPKKILIS